ncbi:MAG: hypothetical protein WD058_07975, partial [Dehalococcoidia bacterium]
AFFPAAHHMCARNFVGAGRETEAASPGVSPAARTAASDGRIAGSVRRSTARPHQIEPTMGRERNPQMFATIQMIRAAVGARLGREEGQGMVEYSLIVGTISIIIVAAFLTGGITGAITGLSSDITALLTPAE